MRRPRGPGGRFLTAEEIAAQKANQPPDVGPSASTSQNGDEDDDLQLMEQDLEHDSEMASPVDDQKHAALPLPPSTQEKPLEPLQQPRPTIQPPLQPRPQVQIHTQAHAHSQMQRPQLQTQRPQPTSQSQQQQTQSMQAPSPHHHQPVQSPYEHHMTMAHSNGSLDLLNVNYHPVSHPATPTPISPHPSMSEGMQASERVQHMHSHAGHTQHDHPRHVSGHTGNGQPVAPTPAPAVTLRSPFQAMQMHHVPHPHAHARHHHSYVNRAEQLYAEQGIYQP
ncbi:hypothetical protein EW026_g1689 [Hermanssonia centrifuga]|uniref:Transcriptional activator HAP2 n=1 Tax=Hermanssonia centrifuga TaxID=98765 RepID=A0A4S4KV55_9APHY|nr:hypothetical protein EW026_g1689 [Hermanssonia centrifuga]